MKPTHYWRQWTQGSAAGVPEKVAFADPGANVPSSEPKPETRLHALEIVNKWNAGQAPCPLVFWRYWV